MGALSAWMGVRAQRTIGGPLGAHRAQRYRRRRVHVRVETSGACRCRVAVATTALHVRLASTMGGELGGECVGRIADSSGSALDLGLAGLGADGWSTMRPEFGLGNRLRQTIAKSYSDGPSETMWSRERAGVCCRT